MGWDKLRAKITAVKTELKETEEQAKKTGEATKALSLDERVASAVKRSGLNIKESDPLFYGLIRQMAQQLDILKDESKLGALDRGNIEAGLTRLEDVLRKADPFGNFAALRRFLEEEIPRGVTKVIEKEKRLAREGSGGFTIGTPLPTKPTDTLPQQISKGQVRG